MSPKAGLERVLKAKELESKVYQGGRVKRKV